MQKSTRRRFRRSVTLFAVAFASMAAVAVVAQQAPQRRAGATIPGEHAYPRQSWPTLAVTAGDRRFRTVSFDGHVHTAYSHDARHPVRDVMVLADRVGLDAIMLTDHGTSRAEVDMRDFTGNVIPIVGSEMGGRYGHALTWAYVDPPRRRAETEFMEMDTLAQYVHAQNGLVVLAHPGWFIDGNHVNPRYYMQYDVIRRGGRGGQLDGIEIWNAMYAAPTAGLLDEWLGLLDRGVYVPITGGTDFHSFGQIVDLGSPRNMVLCAVGRDGALTQSKRDCAMEGMRTGRSYITDGPSIDLQVNGKVFGELLTPAVGEDVTIDVRAIAFQNATLRVRIGHTDVRTFPLVAGQERGERIRYRVTADTYVFVEIQRNERVDRKSEFWTISNPVRIDVPPLVADWRGPVVTDVPVRVPREWTRAGLRH